MKKKAVSHQWGDRMKVHLRHFTIHAKQYSIITLRPGLKVQWSSNYFHETWHILGTMRSAKILARLMWGLSYQKIANTYVLIDSSYMFPNPFDAASSDPILLGTSKPSKELLIRLKKPLGASQQTIRWHTFSLSNLIQNEDLHNDFMNQYYLTFKRKQALVTTRMKGFLTIYGNPQLLRYESFWIHRLHTAPSAEFYRTTDYHYIDDARSYPPQGEVQIFHDYRKRLADAKQAREEILASQDPPTNPAELQRAIQDRALQLYKARKVSNTKQLEPES